MFKFICILTFEMFFMVQNLDAAVNYKVLSTQELKKIEAVKMNEIDNSYIVDYNGAFAISFKDGTAILLPPIGGGDEGVLFYKVVFMENMIKTRVYPVKSGNSFWENEKHRVLDLNESISYYCSKLTQMLKYNVKVDFSEDYLKSLSNVVNASLRSQKNRLLVMYLSIYIGELIRMKINAKWCLSPQKALNVYYIPEIVKGNEFCSHWNFVIGKLEMATFLPIAIEDLVEQANVFYPLGNRALKEIN